MNNKKFIFLYVSIFIICSLFVTIPALAVEQTAQQIAKKAFPSVVLLVLEDSNGQSVSLGSGFFVKQGIIATNLHVLEGASRGYAKLVGKKEKYTIEGTVGIDPEHDLVILKVQSKISPSLALGDSSSIEVGETVYAVGNPQGLEGTFSQGIVSSVRDIGEDRILQITAPISPGSSGGPLLNTNSQVIGVSVATYKEGQNLNFAIPSNYLKTLISKTGDVKKLSGLKLKESKSVFSDMGEKSTDGVTGEKFTWDSSLQCGDYSFSIHNLLASSIKNVYCLIVFYDQSDTPIDFSVITYKGIIPSGLSKRILGRVEVITEMINSPNFGSKSNYTYWDPPRDPQSKVEIRTLDFQLIK
jgi:hypothetical protein